MKLQPWGEIPEERRFQAGTNAMLDWPKGEDWKQFCKDRIAEFRDNLWPEWDRGTTDWDGNAKPFAQEMTRIELELCIERFQTAGVLNSYPKMHWPNGVTVEQRTHLWHYKVEDFIGYDVNAIGFGPEAENPISNFVLYDPSQKLGTIWKTFGDLAGRKASGLFQFKLIFQRPRPYAAAMILGVDGFKHHAASRHIHTGAHPSFPSGHCLQGLMFAAGLIDDMLSETPISDINVDAIMQYGVDFGDRRTFAGVHYPTDNIASWLTALHLSELIFNHPKVIKKLITDAIRQKSQVYGLINEAYRNEPALKVPVALLDKALGS